MNIQLFEDNSSNLKHIFSRISSKDGQLGLANFQVFCKNLNIVPALIMPIDLKRFVDRIIKVPSSRATLKYSQFESILKDICYSSFQSSNPSDRVALFFTHINQPCLQTYKVPLIGSSRRKHNSNDFSKREESSLDIDLNIKEALETLKSKDESFRSSKSTLSREVSPVPSIKRASVRLESVSSSTSKLKTPYSGRSVQDSPNNSILGARPNSRYHNPVGKESELDEFLKNEKLVEKEIVKGPPLSKPLPKQPPKNTISIKKIEYSKSKPELMLKAKKDILPKIDRKNTPLKKISVSLDGTKSDELLKKHKKFIKKTPKLFSNKFALALAFMIWKG